MMRPMIPAVIRKIGLSFVACLCIGLPIRGGIAAPAVPTMPSSKPNLIPSPLLLTPASPSYADLADLSELSSLILRAEIRKVAVVEPARSGNLRAGFVRLYIEARMQSVLRGALPAGTTLHYLADVPVDSKGKPPALSKKQVLLIARSGAIAANAPWVDLQLVAPDAQFIWDAALEARLRALLAELYAPESPSPIKSVREAIYVPGTLAGEGETQLFLSTPNGSPASITVIHAPGKPVSWSVSFSEVMDQAGSPPAQNTLAWYRLACFLPAALPPGSNVSGNAADRAQAVRDYRMVIGALGPCGRTRG